MIRNWELFTVSFFFDLFHAMKHLRYNRNSRMELHHRLRKAREAKGLGVQEVADVLKVKRVQVWRMEKDASFISIARLNELAKLYGVEASSLLDDTVEYQSNKLPIQIIEMAMEAVEGVASDMVPSPTTSDVRAATIKVVRLMHEHLANEPNSQIDTNQFTMLIKDILQADE